MWAGNIASGHEESWGMGSIGRISHHGERSAVWFNNSSVTITHQYHRLPVPGFALVVNGSMTGVSRHITHRHALQEPFLDCDWWEGLDPCLDAAWPREVEMGSVGCPRFVSLFAAGTGRRFPPRPARGWPLRSDPRSSLSGQLPGDTMAQPLGFPPPPPGLPSPTAQTLWCCGTPRSRS